jgi:hypothetical protein
VAPFTLLEFSMMPAAMPAEDFWIAAPPRPAE